MADHASGNRIFLICNWIESHSSCSLLKRNFNTDYFKHRSENSSRDSQWFPSRVISDEQMLVTFSAPRIFYWNVYTQLLFNYEMCIFNYWSCTSFFLTLQSTFFLRKHFCYCIFVFFFCSAIVENNNYV